MKKQIIMGLALLSCFIFSGVSLAETVAGTIAAINGSKNEIIVKDKATGMDKSVVVNAKVMSALKTGGAVKAELKPNSNVAQSVEVVIG